MAIFFKFLRSSPDGNFYYPIVLIDELSFRLKDLLVGNMSLLCTFFFIRLRLKVIETEKKMNFKIEYIKTLVLTNSLIFKVILPNSRY